MIISYFAIFQYDNDGICISFPDVPFCLSCSDVDDNAFKMATEALELALHGLTLKQLPLSSELDTSSLLDNQRIIKVAVNMEVRNGKLYCPKVITPPPDEKTGDGKTGDGSLS